MNVTDLPIIDSAAALTPTYSATDFFIGLGITMGASVLNAFGLNITKLDHERQTALPKAQRTRADWTRPLWLVGLFCYISSQLVGSTLALAYLRAEYVAPLGSSSLIFNFIFARLILKAEIQRVDIIGTLIIIGAVVGVIVAGDHRSSSSDDIEARLSQPVLHELWAKSAWIAYFIILEIVTVLLGWTAHLFQSAWNEREAMVDTDEGAELNPEDRYGLNAKRNVKPEGLWANVQARFHWASGVIEDRIARWAESKPDMTVRRVLGFLWAAEAGILAGQTLIFGKSVVKIISTQTAYFSLLFLVLLVLVSATAVTQIVCLNLGLRAADSTLVVPVLFACYSFFSFVNSLFYLDQLNAYTKTTTAFIVLSLLLLLVGVAVLSSKKSEAPAKTAETIFAEDDLEANSSAIDLADLKTKAGSEEGVPRSASSQPLHRAVDADNEAEATPQTADDSPFDDHYAIGNDSKDSIEEFSPFVTGEVPKDKAD